MCNKDRNKDKTMAELVNQLRYASNWLDELTPDFNHMQLRRLQNTLNRIKKLNKELLANKEVTTNE